jgi:hypothetical protein
MIWDHAAFNELSKALEPRSVWPLGARLSRVGQMHDRELSRLIDNEEHVIAVTPLTNGADVSAD